MRIGTQAVALASIQAQKQLAVAANNIANINTPGFKKEVMHFQDFVSQNTHTKWDQGHVRQTNNPLDIALEGDGFLKIQTADGIRYTRAGNLTLSKDNTLVTQQGNPVLGRKDELSKPAPIQLTNKTIRIGEGGQVFDGDQSVGTLDLARFGSETTLIREQHGLVKPANDTDPVLKADKCSIRQNYLEGANFDLVEEMTNMVETMRTYEAYQKAFKTGAKDLDSELISKLGGT
jgi:flagellar basal-body rod protein FlgG